MKIKNPYGSSLINSNPCNQGTVSISTPSKGNYSISSYISSSKKIATHTIGTTWTPVKVTGYTTWTKVTANQPGCWKKVTATTSGSWGRVKP